MDKMLTPAPRHIRDLLAFLDSEDECGITPRKPQKRNDANQALCQQNEQIKNCDKENEKPQDMAVIHQLRKDNQPIRAVHDLFPRRREELTMMDSDSDDDDNRNSNNLNCAILNDSFVLSPMQELTGSTSSIPSKEEGSLISIGSNLSFLGRFGNMGIDCSSSKPQEVRVETKKKLDPPQKKPPPSTLQIIAEQRKALESKTPLRSVVTSSVKTLSKSEAEFATPQVSSLVTRKSTRTQTLHKNRNERANEFCSQKVLFQTPMTVSRGAPFTSDSISFSLCDTINESPDTPAQPQQRVEAPSISKSKKSLECEFRQAGNVKPEVPMPPPVEMPAPMPIPAPVAQPPKATSPQPETSSKISVLKIKNYEYELVKVLGCGGSSSVYLARRKDTGKEYALKVVDLQADLAVVEGYLNETKLLEKLQGNASVVSLYDYQLLRQESKLYMVMEKGDSDLNKLLQKFRTTIPLYNLVNIFYQMLLAVNYIHQNGVIHSDLKPANFLIVKDRLKLIDFGISSNIAVDSTSIIKFSQAGTFNYISPEALTDISTGTSPIRGSNQPKIKISTKSDVWSLGCILYLMIYQKTPFGHIRNINAKISAITSRDTIIEYPPIPMYYPPMLLHMLKNCLQLNPQKRLSCGELLKYPFEKIISIHKLQIEPEP